MGKRDRQRVQIEIDFSDMQREILAWVSESFEPDEVFEVEQLQKWVKENEKRG